MPRLSDAQFRLMYESLGADRMAAEVGMDRRSIQRRRRRLEAAESKPIHSPQVILQDRAASHKARRSLKIQDGIVLAISDQHYWPGIISTAHAGFVEFCGRFGKDLRAVIWNGDVVDGATISRHARIGWEYQPSFCDELEAVRQRSAEVEAATNAPKYWLLGNHDARFETRIAAELPQLERVHGVHLKDHFPVWETGWSLFINEQIAIKHRFKGGLHAGFNNAMWSGMSMMTGHTHKGIVYHFTDYRGTRWGVELPTGAEPNGPQFMDYTEDNPKNHRSGFSILTFIDGTLCQPELALVHDVGVIEFRGDRIKV